MKPASRLISSSHHPRILSLLLSVCFTIGLGACGGGGNGTDRSAKNITENAGSNGPTDTQWCRALNQSATEITEAVLPEGILKTRRIAGNYGGYGYQDGLALDAQFQSIAEIAQDSCGNILIADRTAVRKLTPNGRVSTLAGSEISGYSDGIGTSARFQNLAGIAVDLQDNIYVTDSSSHTIRKITPQGLVSTFAGTPGESGFINGLRDVARFSSPSGIVVDPGGNLYVADKLNYVIRKITPQAQVSTYAGSGVKGLHDGDGNLLTAQLNEPTSVAIDVDGNLYVMETTYTEIPTTDPRLTEAQARNRASRSIRKISIDGAVTRLPGLNREYAVGPAVDAQGNVYTTSSGYLQKLNGESFTTQKIWDGVWYDRSSDVLVDQSGNILVSRSGGIIKLDPQGKVTALAGNASFNGSANGEGSDAEFYNPVGITKDAEGNLYVADRENGSLRKVTPDGVVSRVPGSNNGQSGVYRELWNVAVDIFGNIYTARWVDDQHRKVERISPDGQVSTYLTLRTTRIDGIATDLQGNVYVSAGLIYKVTPEGTVTQLAPANSQGKGVAIDRLGNIYVADFYSVYRVSQSGDVALLAGGEHSYEPVDGIGSEARFPGIKSITMDEAGNIYVISSSQSFLQKITPQGEVTTVGQLMIGITNTNEIGMTMTGPKTIAVAAPHGVIEVQLP